MGGRILPFSFFSFLYFVGCWAQTWCGKNYLPHQPVVAPGGKFPQPRSSGIPLLAFRCTPSVKPYLEEDASKPGIILIDTPVTFRYVHNAAPIYASVDSLTVSISISGKPIGEIHVPVNSSAVEVPFSLGRMTPQTAPYVVDCVARARSTCSDEEGEQTFHASSALLYLPNPSSGSVTKTDFKTGALMVKSSTGLYEPVFPFGFYTSFGNYLDRDLSILNGMKAQGFNLVHPVPPFHNSEALTKVLDRMEELGIFLMYDMRHTYQDPQQLTAEVNMIKNRTNLLLWYTADEPDGPSDPLDATTIACDLIHEADGYHPVSIALNCADYHFTEYVVGADIVMPDTYMIGNNVQFSTKYNTSCTVEFGCCGCDNCEGTFEDISRRLDEYRDRLQALGWDRTKIIWSVTQAFGGDEFWSRAPTGKEWLVQALLSVNHGARGIIPWIDPTPSDIKDAASLLAKALPEMKTYLFDPLASFTHFSLDHTDMGQWALPFKTLVVITNLGSAVTLRSLPGAQGKAVRWLLNVDVSIVPGPKALDFVCGSLGSAVFILSETTARHDLRDEL